MKNKIVINWTSVDEKLPPTDEDGFSEIIQIKCGKTIYKNVYYDSFLKKWFRTIKFEMNEEVTGVTHWDYK